jgi:F0F1-type ATP synthase assembly protein I
MAQLVQIGQKRSMPAQAYQLATEQRVGTPVARYSSRFLTTLLLGIVVGAPGGYLVLFSFLGRFSLGTIFLLLLGLSLVAYAVSRVVVAFQNLGAQVYLCTDGLMRVTDGTAEAICWDQTWEFWKVFSEPAWYGLIGFIDVISSFTGQDSSANYRGTFQTLQEYRLRQANGTELVLAKRRFRKFKKLGKVIEQEVTHHLLPSALAAYNAGQPVSFGEISVSGQGIHIRSRQETIAWNELNMVRGSGRLIYINWKKQGHLLASTRTIPIAETPNVCMLTELVKTIRESQQSQKR